MLCGVKGEGEEKKGKIENKILSLGVIIFIFIALMFIGIEGWSSLIAPNLGKLSQFSLPLLIAFSFLAGMISFFAPCAFALFPGYVAFYLGSEKEEEKKEQQQSPAKLGLVASLGVITFFILLSIVITIVGKNITQYLGYIAPTIGFIVLILGLILFLGYSFKTSLIQRLLDKLKSKETRSKRNMYLFGFGYGAVSIGCTLPLLFAMIIVPLTTGKIAAVFLSLLFYSLGMSVLMIFVTYLVAWSENNLIKKMIKSTGTIKKLSGIALIVIGGYLVYYNIFYGMLL